MTIGNAHVKYTHFAYNYTKYIFTRMNNRNFLMTSL